MSLGEWTVKDVLRSNGFELRYSPVGIPGMAHPIVNGKITLLKCVTPGSYWIKCRNCSGNSKLPSSISHKPYSGDYYPSQDEAVFVHDSDNYFYRGKVLGQRKSRRNGVSSPEFSVQLVDTFQVKDFDLYNIYPTLGETSVNCGSAHLVSLCDVLPYSPPPEYPHVKQSSKILFEECVRQWHDLNSLLDHLVLNTSLVFYYKESTLINMLSYGHLYYKKDNSSELFGLKKYLISKEIAVDVPVNFENTIEALMYTPLHKAAQMLPVVTLRPNFSTKTDYDLSLLKVFEKDAHLYESLKTRRNTVNVFFTKPPVDSDSDVIRFVTPEGFLVMGTVLDINVKHYYLDDDDILTEEDRHSDLLKAYLSQHTEVYDIKHHSDWDFRQAGVLPSSEDEDNSENVEHEHQQVLNYNFSHALKDFYSLGGILEEHSNSPISANKLAYMEQLFRTLRVDQLEAWQKVCLPSFVMKNNILVLGHLSNKKLTTSVIAILTELANIKSRQNLLMSKSPKCVIFVPNYKRAYHVARLVKSLSNLNIIVSASLLISAAQKTEAGMGCDIMITIPTNWLELTQSYKILDFSNVVHVLFDSFEKLNASYGKELAVIFHQVKGHSERIQTIILSNVWGTFLMNYLGLVESPTRCVTDIIQSMFCYRLKPTVMFITADGTNNFQHIFKGGNNLLLCSDYEEVSDIWKQTHEMYSMLYVDEVQDSKESLQLINLWKTSSKVLVSSDILFDRMKFTTEASVLISWMTSSRSTLVKRFIAIRDHPTSMRHKLSVVLCCNSDSMEELTFIHSILDGIPDIQFIGGDLNENIRACQSVKEKDNSKNTFCSNICMFGECKAEIRCPSRHHFIPGDSFFINNNSNYLVIQPLRFYDAFHFSARVKNAIGNNNEQYSMYHQFYSDIAFIERKLSSAYTQFLEDAHTKKSIGFKIGDVVGAIIESGSRDLRRATVLSVTLADKYEVEFMDYDEPVRIMHSDDLFIIPPSLIRHPKVVVHFYSTGLAPADVNADWPHDTKHCLNKYFELVLSSKEYSCVAKVAAIVSEFVLTESIYFYRTCNKHAVLGEPVKDLIIKSGYVVKNPSHLENLSKLATSNGKLHLIPTYEGQYGFRRNIPTHEVTCVVSSFDNPNLCYVRLEDEEAEYKRFEMDLSNHMDKSKQPLRVIAAGEMCAILNGYVWNRALIMGAGHSKESSDMRQEVNIMYVDYGDAQLVHCEELFVLPDNFERLPFFAIECSLVGIRPIYSEWSEEAIGYLRNCIRNEYAEMKTMRIRFCGIVSQNWLSKQFRHHVILNHANEQLSVNEAIVTLGMGGWFEDTASILFNGRNFN